MIPRSVTIKHMGVFAEGLKAELKRLNLSYDGAAAIAYPHSRNAESKVGRWVRGENEPKVGDAQEFAAIGTSLLAILVSGTEKTRAYEHLRGVDLEEIEAMLWDSVRDEYEAIEQEWRERRDSEPDVDPGPIGPDIPGGNSLEEAIDYALELRRKLEEQSQSTPTPPPQSDGQGRRGRSQKDGE